MSIENTKEMPNSIEVAWDNFKRISMSLDMPLAEKWRQVNDITEHVLYMRVHLSKENFAIKQMHYLCAFALAELVDETLEKL